MGTKKSSAIERKEEAPIVEAPEGLEGITPADVILPRVKIDHDGEGLFRVTVTGDCYAEIGVVPLRFSPGRRLWSKDLTITQAVCASDDGLRPARWISEPKSTECTRIEGRQRVPLCPCAQWGDEGAADRKPECSETFDFLIALVSGDGEVFDVPMPAVISFHRTGLACGRRIATALALNGQGRGLAIYDNGFYLRLAQKKHGSKTYFVPEPHTFAPVDPLGRFADLARSVARYDIEDTDRAERGDDA